jgi:NADH-quinone oxidoreductase subunit L
MNSKILCALVPFLPLLGFLINGIGFRKVGNKVIGIVATFASIMAFVVSIMLFNQFLAGGSKPMTFHYFNWITVAELNISFSFLIDQLSLLMLMVVTGVGSLIHLYSIGYMSHDEAYGKFMAYLNLFMVSMLLLVLGANYVIMFIGWEGVGLCSFLLIGFWNKNKEYNYAARKAFVMNRIGDLGLLIGIFFIIWIFKSADYETVFAKATEFTLRIAKGELNAKAAAALSVDGWVYVSITIALFIGAMGKSAQIPLYTWLPDAMAGPTPVSALIHAATMVTAGIYMVVRSNVLYTLAPTTQMIILVVAITTALVAATIGIFQNDIKKVLAYSTVSQLGYMFLGLGVAAYSSSMFHVITHAFFKALLFLGAGSVIHAIHNQQDIRKMGGLRKYMPITFITFLVATIAISGIPPFAGFFSKDEILMHVYEKSPLIWGLALLGSAMTSFYMFRLLFLTFFGEFRGTDEQKLHLHESPIVMTLPLMILAILSIVGGLLGVPEVFSTDSNWLEKFTMPLFELSRKINPKVIEASHMSHSQEYILMGISVTVALISLVIAYVMYISKKIIPKPDDQLTGIPKLIYNKYYVDEIYDTVFSKPILWLSKTFATTVEGAIDFFVEGAGRLSKFFGSTLKNLQTGSVGFYVFAMVVGMLVILAVNFVGR